MKSSLYRSYRKQTHLYQDPWPTSH
jgi:hypothetical protein